jgi:gamma-glutamyltranspeptidase/glutathione hydrolase
LFGAKVANAKLGFLYNNYLCTCPRYAHPYQMGSRAMPRSNVAPTIVFGETTANDIPVLALGAAGSRRITSSVLQVISSVMDRSLSIQAALDAPRVHALVSRKVWVERDAASEELTGRLKRRFRKVIVKSRHDYKMGAVQAIGFDAERKMLAAADPRRDGTGAIL